MARALLVLAEGFEEIEAICPIDILRRAGVEVVCASLGEGIHVTGRSGITLHADTTLEKVLEGGAPEAAFEMLIVPGGPAVTGMREDGRAARLAAGFASAGRLVAAICAAPLVLRDAGLLAGKHFTAHQSTAPELPEALFGEAVVVDGGIITSRGAGTALAFALELAAALAGGEVSDAVAESVMV
jgi:4-methyl-5(b-hydroxyethyl)-thiazole monophosphate biosynthesis